MSENTNRPPDSRNSAKRLSSAFVSTGPHIPIALLRQEMREAMDGKFVKMEAEKFLDSFLKVPHDVQEPSWVGVFDEIVGGVKESDLCKALVRFYYFSHSLA